MGSLTAGWDTTRPGKAPKGFEDFKEPVSPRLHAKTTTPFGDASHHSEADKAAAGGPPNLRRTSAPPMHGASAVKRYLERASSGSPGAPASPRTSTPRAAHGPPKLTLKLGDEELNGLPLTTKERWCTRVESSRLNERPDEGDEDQWRHGSFKLNDAAHAMHLSPRAAAAEAAAAQGPFTPVAAPSPAPMQAPRPRVTVEKIPEEAMASLDSCGL